VFLNSYAELKSKLKGVKRKMVFLMYFILSNLGIPFNYISQVLKNCQAKQNQVSDHAKKTTTISFKVRVIFVMKLDRFTINVQL
jgi:hypothetical protein